MKKQHILRCDWKPVYVQRKQETLFVCKMKSLVSALHVLKNSIYFLLMAKLQRVSVMIWQWTFLSDPHSQSKCTALFLVALSIPTGTVFLLAVCFRSKEILQRSALLNATSRKNWEVLISLRMQLQLCQTSDIYRGKSRLKDFGVLFFTFMFFTFLFSTFKSDFSFSENAGGSSV